GLVGCGSGATEPPPPPAPPATELGCGSTTDVNLAAGDAKLVAVGAGADCVRLRAAAQTAEYLIVATSGAPDVVDGGVTADYRLMGRSATSAAAGARWLGTSRSEKAGVSERFHALLRERERSAASVRHGTSLQAPAAVARPLVGDART